MGRTREGLTTEVNLEITTTAGGYQSTSHSLSSVLRVCVGGGGV